MPGGAARKEISPPPLPDGVVWVAGQKGAPSTTLHSVGNLWELEVEVREVPEAGRIEVVAAHEGQFSVLSSFDVAKDRAGAYRLRFEKSAVPEGLAEVLVVVRLGARAVAVGQALIA